MSTNTTNLSLFKPDVDETDWGASVNGNFDIIDAKAFASNVVTFNTTPNTLTLTQEIVLVDVSAADVEIRLPAASTCEGKTVYIKVIAQSGAYYVWLHPNGTDTIEGIEAEFQSSSTSALDFIKIVSDGVSGWWIINNSGFAESM